MEKNTGVADSESDRNNVAAGDWVVYMIRSDDERLYTGITNNIERRWQQHNDGSGAKFFRGRKPQELVFIELGHTKGSALRREAAIKKLRRVEKLALILVGQKVGEIKPKNKPPALVKDAGGKRV